MAGVNVSPPPLNTPLIDLRTGMPTPAMVDFIHKIWLRTGGTDDNDDFLLRMLTGGGVLKGQRPPTNAEDYRYQRPDSPLAHEAIEHAQLAKLLAQVRMPDSPVMHEALEQANTASMLAQMPKPKSFDVSQIGKGTVPIGAILLWSGSIANIPDGYALCDGSGGTPDVANLFIRAAVTDETINSTGGANERETSVELNGTGGAVGVTTQGVASGTDFNAVTGATYNEPVNGHSHVLNIDTVPEYYALALIMRIQ